MTGRRTALSPTAGSAARRRFLRLASACFAAASTVVSGCASLLRSNVEASPSSTIQCIQAGNEGEFDYVIVGSGAGGGPLAANLARAGFKVLLLEAGSDEDFPDYAVPAFHARASEDERMAWNFYVRHYSDDTRQKRDEKFVDARDGVLYPRCAALGGCTAHNAMILVYPHNSDWDHIAELTGDTSWRSEKMRAYFERLECCEYPSRAERGERHGENGWLATNIADPTLVVRDTTIPKIGIAALQESLGPVGARVAATWNWLRNGLDPNGWSFARNSAEGIVLTPLTTHEGKRVGSREFVERVVAACPAQLSVRTHALATRVLFDEARRAIGVEYLAGSHLYGADPLQKPGGTPPRVRVTARREVILCAGTFNTPQLLKLSGIGPRPELERHGIPVVADLRGVGENLQDRYEISVVTRMKHDFSLMRGMKLRPPLPGETPDEPYLEWQSGKGPYTTNGVVVSLVKRSSPDRPEPDLFIFGLLGTFKGYFPGYSRLFAQHEDLFTWAILKAHTNNASGHVTLRSSDPCEVPQIDFNYFSGDSGSDDDLEAVVAGVETVRRINRRCEDITQEELIPGAAVETRAQIREFIKDNAWGHHACGTCRMGPVDDPESVVDSRFRVRGVRGLRVVDASVFPRIPGFFIALAVYMVSEKAFDAVVEDADSGQRS